MRLRDEFHFEPPREHGLDTVDSVRALRDGEATRLRRAWAATSCPAAPDTVVVEEAMRGAD